MEKTNTLVKVFGNRLVIDNRVVSYPSLVSRSRNKQFRAVWGGYVETKTVVHFIDN